jgi:fatty acid desaturase
MFNTAITRHDTQEKIYLKDIYSLRQSFIIASVFILLGVVLAHYIHPYFIALTLLVGGGLLFSGSVGWCPLSLILEQMPWNKK